MRSTTPVTSIHTLTPAVAERLFDPADYTVEQVTFQQAREVVVAGHYTHSLTKGRLCYGMFRNGVIIGVAVYGQPSGRKVASSVWEGGDETNTVELLRLFLWDSTGKNAESWFIAKTIKLLPREIKVIVAYASPGAGHYGAVYQASNWLYVGRSKSGQNYHYVDADGMYVNKRIPWQYGPRSGRPEIKEKEAADVLGLTRVEEGRKYTYLYLRDRKVRPLLKRQIEDFPKPEPQKVGHHPHEEVAHVG